MTCARPQESLGAYALGSLEPAERADVEAHLAHCPVCAAELSELAAAAGLLGRLSLTDVEALPPAPSEDLYARVVAAAARPRARRFPPARLLVSVAAAAALLAGVGLAVAHHGSAPHHTAAAGHVRITVEATAQASGTALEVQVVGLPENEHCHLVAIARDGSRHTAGDWVATYAGRAEVTGSTDLPRSQLVRLVLYGTAGQQLVSVQV